MIWEREIDIYGSLRKGNNEFVPFLYQGQYVDRETGLAYNRMHYYSFESGMYLSQDPIGLAWNNPTLYGFVKDSNTWIDVFRGSVFKDSVYLFLEPLQQYDLLKKNLDVKYNWVNNAPFVKQ